MASAGQYSRFSLRHSGLPLGNSVPWGVRMVRSARVLLASFVASALAVSGIAVPASGAVDDPITVTVDGSLSLPDGDEVNDEADVLVTAAEPLSVDVDLVDGSGAAVRVLGTEVPL